ncbi:Hypothetical predicted protein, partial [Olea europaea subsp. europaea]
MFQSIFRRVNPNLHFVYILRSPTIHLLRPCHHPPPQKAYLHASDHHHQLIQSLSMLFGASPSQQYPLHQFNKLWIMRAPQAPIVSLLSLMDSATSRIQYYLMHPTLLIVIGKRLKTVEELATLEALQYLSLLIQVMIDAISSTVDSLFNPYMHKI